MMYVELKKLGKGPVEKANTRGGRTRLYARNNNQGDNASPECVTVVDPETQRLVNSGSFSGMGVKGTYVVFFFSGFSCLVTLPSLIFDYHSMTLIQLLYLILAGCSAAAAQFSITAAYFNAPAKEISVYDYSQVIFSAIIGMIVFGQMPDIFSIAGYIIICAMAVIMFIRSKKASERTGSQ